MLWINNVKDATRPSNTKDLFASYEQYNKKDCTELVGTYHGWDYCLPRCDKDDKTVPITDAKNCAYYYAVNSLWIQKEIYY